MKYPAEKSLLFLIFILGYMSYARYGPSDHYDLPAAGMCLSAFVLVWKSNTVLVGIPKKIDRWREDWLYSKRKENSEIFDEWRLPSCYLREGEHPLDAAKRIMREELGASDFQLEESPKIVSYYSPSGWYGGKNHWDLAFVFTVKVSEGFEPSRDAWRELQFCSGKELAGKDFGWNADFVQDLGL